MADKTDAPKPVLDAAGNEIGPWGAWDAEGLHELHQALADIEMLRAALRQCLQFIETREEANGRLYAAGNAARTALGMPPP